MFNKVESNKIKGNCILDNISMKKIGAILVSVTMLTTMYSANVKALAEEGVSHRHIHNCSIEKKRYEYLNLVSEYAEDKKYDESFYKFWEDGQLNINDKFYPLNSFYILYRISDNNKDVHLVSVKLDHIDCLTGQQLDYSNYDIVRFPDTTAFANFYNSNGLQINDNKAVIQDVDFLKKCVSEWDGMIHSLTPETDVIDNKQIIDWEIGYEKTR